MVRRLLLICGILAALIYVGSDILAAISWQGYSYTAQSVSELRAIGAPTRPYLLPILILYGALEFAFGLGVWQTAGPKRGLRITGALLITLAAIDLLLSPFFPMHLRGSTGTLTDTMHIVLTIATVVMILLIIGFGSTARGKGWMLYSIATILLLFACGLWSFWDAPQVAANLPTPWLGVRERINIYGYMLWMMILAIVLLADHAPQPQTRGQSSGTITPTGGAVI